VVVNRVIILGSSILPILKIDGNFKLEVRNENVQFAEPCYDTNVKVIKAIV
jgi:hypothetical protein